MTVQCDRVYISVAHRAQGVTQLTLPAYTVPPAMLTERLALVVDAYFTRSADSGAPVSMADFALYVMQLASDDPFEQPS